MKTFEERYTAWIDGQLTGGALTAFEQELDRRAQAGDADAAESDKASALSLRGLLRDHLQAPTLTNTEFFNHQMRERIDAEIDRAAARREAAMRPAFRLPAFAWPLARLAGVGVVCLFVAGALYYGMVPKHQDGTRNVAVAPAAGPVVQSGNQSLATSEPAAPQTTSTDHQGPTELVFQNHPTPAPVDMNDDIQAHVVTPNAGNNTSATPLHVGKASVLWVDGLTYLPDVANMTSSPAPAPSATPAPAASAVPSATP